MKGLPKKILVTLLTVVALGLALPLAERVGVELPGFGIEAEAASYSGTCGDNVNWSLDTDTGVLSISGTGAMTNYLSYDGAPWYSYRSSIKSVTIGNSVTSIGNYAFFYCDGLTSVTIGNSVESIGSYAFYGCKGLTSVTIGNSVESIGSSAFSYCDGLTSVTIPNSVESIGSSAFRDCTGLESVTIPDKVTSIGSSAFRDCTGLTSITVDKNNPNYSSDEYGVLFDKAKTMLIQYPVGNTRTEYIIPNSVTSIGDYAFSGCTGLTSVTIGNSVESIGSSAFYGCKGLTSVTIGNSVESIGSYAFYGCTGLKSVTIGNSVENIGSSAFSGCTGLTSITIPDSVTSIGDSAFYGCTGLTSITIPDSVTSIGDKAFSRCIGLTSITVDKNNPNYSSDEYGVLFDKAKTMLIQYPVGNTRTEYIIPNSVTSIGSYAFYGCTGLKSVTIGNSVENIGSSAFSGCTGLTSIIIPDSVTSIGSYAFYDCTGLTSIIIPDSVTSISNYAFAGCTGLTSIIIPDSVESIGSSAFSGCTGLTSVTIPDSVESIGNYAFYCCTGLTSVTIGNSVTSIGIWAFYDCTGLTSITIGNSVESIGFWAFLGCTGLAKTNYTGTIAQWCSIIFDVYANPVNYSKNLYLNDKLVTDLVIPDGVTSIGDDAFSYCQSITSVTIPDSVESIGSGAFRGCTGLTSITVDKNNQYYCNDEYGVLFNKDKTTLIQYPIGNTRTEYIIPDSVESIGSSAFRDCTGLESVTIPDKVTSIGSSAFRDCTGLTSVTIPNSVTSIGSSAFSGCTGLTSVTIGNSVESIGSSAFYGCKGLTSVTIGNSVESIGSYAFYGCTGLTSITIGNSVESIGEWAFYGCKSLKDVYYGGSEADWAKISIGSYNSPLTNATIHYSPCQHSMVTSGAPATCTVAGYEFTMCEKCGEISGAIKTLTALGHDYESTVTPPTCTEKGYTTHICKRSCGEENAELIDSYVDALGHAWSVEWTWAEDYGSATAAFTCGNDASHTEAVTDSDLESDTTPATCTKDGKTVYTATVTLDGKDYTDEKTAVIAALGHAWEDDYTVDLQPTCTEEGSKSIHCERCGEKSDITAIPANGHSYGEWYTTKEPDCVNKGTKRRDCENCSHYETGEIAALGHAWEDDYTVDLQPTCTEEGSKSIHCERCGEKSNITVIPATGHNYGEPVWKWSGYTGATASFTCANGNTHTDKLTAKITSEITTAPTCTESGIRTYTATVTLEGKTYTNTKTEKLAAIGHAWSLESWAWAEDCNSATASFICTNNSEHTHTVTDSKTDLVNTPPTCTAEGSKVYTAKVALEGKNYSDKKTVTVPATGHAYGEPVWTWNGYTGASAKFTCANNTAHIETVKANITTEIITAPTCTEGGEQKHTATVVFGAKTYTSTKNEELPPNGHSWGEWETVKEADYNVDGLKRRICTVETCKAVDEQVIEKLGIKLEDNENGIDIELPTGTYDEDDDIELEVVDKSDGTSHFGINGISNGGGYKVFDITLKVNGEAIQPNGKVKVYIPLPEDFSGGNIRILHIEVVNGKYYYNLIPSKIENGYIVFETDHFSLYSVVDVKTAEMVSIRVEKAPAKTAYDYKSTVSQDGLVVKAVYSDNTETDITNYVTLSGFDANSTGTKTATVKYNDLTATFEYTVKYTWWQWIIRILLLGIFWY